MSTRIDKAVNAVLDDAAERVAAELGLDVETGAIEVIRAVLADVADEVGKQWRQ